MADPRASRTRGRVLPASSTTSRSRMPSAYAWSCARTSGGCTRPQAAMCTGTGRPRGCSQVLQQGLVEQFARACLAPCVTPACGFTRRSRNRRSLLGF